MIYDYKKRKIKFKISEKRKEDGLLSYTLSFPSKVTTKYPENNTVWAYCWKPVTKKKLPAIIFLHSWGGTKESYCGLLARLLAKQGYATFLLNLPYHMARTPAGHGNGALFVTSNYEQTFNSFRQAVIDLRCLIDVIEQLKGIDKKRIGVLGTSLGAFMAHTAMGVDTRLKVGATLGGGGDLARLATRSIIVGIPLTIAGLIIYIFSPKQRRKGWLKYFFRLVPQYRSYLKKVWKVKDVDKVKPTMRWYWLDPLTYAYRNKPRKVMMIHGRYDIVIPKGCVVELWKALGKPKIIWLPTTHFSAAFFRKSVTKEIVKYFKENL